MSDTTDVTITIHTTSEEPYWTITCDATGRFIHEYIAGWYGEEPGEVCEDTTWKKLRAYCDSKGWKYAEAWS
jgi:hypothetical protein